MKRNRYLNFTVRHTSRSLRFLKTLRSNVLSLVPAKEVEALKVAVNAELRRVEQLEE